jgi:hypothetical protein
MKRRATRTHQKPGVDNHEKTSNPFSPNPNIDLIIPTKENEGLASTFFWLGLRVVG